MKRKKGSPLNSDEFKTKRSHPGWRGLGAGCRQLDIFLCPLNREAGLRPRERSGPAPESRQTRPRRHFCLSRSCQETDPARPGCGFRTASGGRRWWRRRRRALETASGPGAD